MQTTKQLIDRAKTAQGISSDYRLSKQLEVSTSAVLNWRAGRSHPDDVLGARLAALAGMEPGLVVAELHAERARTPEAIALWTKIAEQLRWASNAFNTTDTTTGPASLIRPRLACLHY